jgi:hypothetical protein
MMMSSQDSGNGLNFVLSVLPSFSVGSFCTLRQLHCHYCGMQSNNHTASTKISASACTASHAGAAFLEVPQPELGPRPRQTPPD